MIKQEIHTSLAPEPVGPYSQAIKAAGLLFVSGQIPLDPKTGKLVEGDFEAQARRTLDNLKAVVEHGGSSIQKVVKVTIFLKDLSRFEEFNKIYKEYFDLSRPARACVEVSRLPKDVEVEVEAIAISDR